MLYKWKWEDTHTHTHISSAFGQELSRHNWASQPQRGPNCRFKSYCTPWNWRLILAVSMAVNFTGSSENSCFPQPQGFEIVKNKLSLGDLDLMANQWQGCAYRRQSPCSRLSPGRPSSPDLPWEGNYEVHKQAETECEAQELCALHMVSWDMLWSCWAVNKLR